MNVDFWLVSNSTCPVISGHWNRLDTPVLGVFLSRIKWPYGRYLDNFVRPTDVPWTKSLLIVISSIGFDRLGHWPKNEQHLQKLFFPPAIGKRVFFVGIESYLWTSVFFLFFLMWLNLALGGRGGNETSNYIYAAAAARTCISAAAAAVAATLLSAAGRGMLWTTKANIEVRCFSICTPWSPPG